MSDTHEKLKKVLTDHFDDEEGFELQLEVGPPDKITGLLTSGSFAGKREYERQDMIWDVLDEELTDDERAQITLIIANTPEETAARDAERRAEGS